MLRAAIRRAASARPARRTLSEASITVDFPGAYTAHLGDEPAATAETNKTELLEYFKTMYTMRRMEITCDNEYKARTIRGFCHLYDGQEAIGTGVQAALAPEDSWITSYRCHCIALARGGTVEGVLAELMGQSHGQTGGKGGSMHFYNKEHNFFGGQGIVGAQVPVGTGLAFANKYKTPLGEPMPVAIGCYGDGAANQGQIWESMNMAALWKLPMIFCIENNQYGMGTSISRSSCNNDYYTMGNVIPGLKMDGMNVLSVREGMKHVRDYVSQGNGPMVVEMSTYRYHGHSMSDPGTTYRNRDEIAAMRQTRDPIEFVKNLLLEHTDATEDELKAIEKDVRAEVAAACDRAKAGSPPSSIDELVGNIYLDAEGKDVPQPYIRMPDYEKSIRA
jgi:pyruvate dehydrogenase E1 component alpha subunit